MLSARPAIVERCLREVGIAFFFAPTFHPAMRHAAQARRDLGVRTAFNLLGPLTNPAGASRQIVGVPRPELTELIARALLLLGSAARLGRARRRRPRRALDDRLHEGVGVPRTARCRPSTCIPSDYGLAKTSLDALKGGDAADNAQRIREVLDGTPGPARNVVLLNAGRRACSSRAG